jgi:hypothetical protein
MLDDEGLRRKTTVASSVIHAFMWRKQLSRLCAFTYGRRNSPRVWAWGGMAKGHGLGRGCGWLGWPWHNMDLGGLIFQ